MGQIMCHRKHPYNGLEVCLSSEKQRLYIRYRLWCLHAMLSPFFSLKYLSFCRYLFVTSEKWTLHLLLFQGLTYQQTSILLLPVQIKWINKIKTALLLINDSLWDLAWLMILKSSHSVQKAVLFFIPARFYNKNVFSLK